MANLPSPVKAIRAKCLDCCVQQVNEVKACPVQDCPLWPFRLGKNPNRHGRPMTDEQKQAAVQRLRAVWQSKREEAQDG